MIHCLRVNLHHWTQDQGVLFSPSSGSILNPAIQDGVDRVFAFSARAVCGPGSQITHCLDAETCHLFHKGPWVQAE